MKKSDDRQLQDYLQGEDGVSPAYAHLRQEKPSAELDERILLAARSAIKGQTKARKQVPYQIYSIAASVCLMVLAATLFLQNEEELTSADVQNRAIPLMDSVEESALQRDGGSSQPAPATAEIQQAARVPPAAAEAQAEALRLESETLARQRVITEDDLAAQAQQAVEDANAQDATAGSVQEFSQQQAGVLNAATQAVQASPANELSYRASAESWLAEIQRLQATEPAQAAEEIRLFALEYPDMDVEAALDVLNEATQNN